MFFDSFPLMTYKFNINGRDELRVVKDITLNVRMRKQVLSNITLFEDYDIIDGDTPERIADKIYGDPNLHWVIMLVNDKFSNITDFPLSNQTLEKYVEDKYGAGNRDVQHILFGNPHFVDGGGNIVSGLIRVDTLVLGNPSVDIPWTDVEFETNPLAISVSNYDHEFTVNESKRRIKLVHPNLIPRVVQDLDSAIQDVNF
jgi:hypothetical protein